MKKILTAFNASKAKQLLRDNLKIKPLQRKEYIMVEDKDFDKAVDLLRQRERLFLKHDIQLTKEILWSIEEYFETHSTLTKGNYKMLKEMSNHRSG